MSYGDRIQPAAHHAAARQSPSRRAMVDWRMQYLLRAVKSQLTSRPGISGATLNDLERRCVLPFYLDMMGISVPGEVPFDTLREVARETTDDEVAQLLGSRWRPRVMGAWLASGRASRLEAALLQSLETARGMLTAPPLATVALYGLGDKAVPSLKAYLQQDLEHQWGSASFVAAVLERLDAAPAGIAVDDQHRKAVDQMLIIARRLAQTDPSGQTEPR